LAGFFFCGWRASAIRLGAWPAATYFCSGREISFVPGILDEGLAPGSDARRIRQDTGTIASGPKSDKFEPRFKENSSALRDPCCAALA
jgi:hypothetical protein